MTLINAEQGALRLEELVRGLLFVSESDSPIRVVKLGLLPELDERAFSKALGKPEGTSVTRHSLGELFDRCVADQDWHGPTERATLERYRRLVAFLGEALADTRVFRIGQIAVEAYALGKTSDGSWLGVATTLVET